MPEGRKKQFTYLPYYLAQIKQAVIVAAGKEHMKKTVEDSTSVMIAWERFRKG